MRVLSMLVAGLGLVGMAPCCGGAGGADVRGPDAEVSEASPGEVPPADPGAADVTPPVPLPFVVPLHTEGRWILDADGKNVLLSGFNWSGGEGPDRVPAGLDQAHVDDIARAIRARGFNSVRLVWSNQLVEDDAVVAPERLAANPHLVGKTALEVLDAVVDALADAGLLVILNNHISDAIWCCQVDDGNTLWYNERYPEWAWLADWQAVARRYRDRPAVIGADLRNEPRLGATWGDRLGADQDWASAAERGGEAVLAEAPDWLIVVEGVAFGRILTDAKTRPIQLSVPGRLVYSSHDYPWSQRKGLDAHVDSYEELRDSCDGFWGYLLEEGQPWTAPVWVGEIGTCNDCWHNGGNEQLWFESLSRYLREREVGWSWWTLNNSNSWGVFDPATGEPFSPGLVAALQALPGVDPAVKPPLVQEFLPPPPAGKRWSLAWNDEFEGTAIDETRWVIGGGTEADPQPRRDGFWVKEAMVLDGEGHLVMRTYEKDGKIFDGVMDTTGTFEHAEGYYEARMDVNKQEGHWCAFWMMGGDWSETGNDEGALDGVEIDVMERPWSSEALGERTNHAIHWDGYAEGANVSTMSKTPGILEGFHTFGLWWGEDLYRFYIDGREVWATDAGGICRLPIPLILSDEVGETVFFGAGKLDPSKLPDRTLVDYVRVYDLIEE